MKIERLSCCAGIKPLAIHDGSHWNERWITYCHDHTIPHKVVNCYDSNILDQIRDCGGLMWMLLFHKPQDMLLGRHVLNAAKIMGLRVFPDFHESWHYDDKVAQKYLFETLQLPAPRAWVFFEEQHALQFVEQYKLPIVAKLRHGASSSNVRLLRTRREARSYVKRMFGQGSSPVPVPLTDAKQKLKVVWETHGARGLWRRMKRIPQLCGSALSARRHTAKERGYAYFQEFIPGNTCDYRLMVVGDRCWAYRRMVRSGDFRASGSHIEDGDPDKIPLDMIRVAFHAADRLGMRSVGLDFVLNGDRPLILEASYCYGLDPGNYDRFWDRDMVRHDVVVDPRDWIIENFWQGINAKPDSKQDLTP